MATAADTLTARSHHIEQEISLRAPRDKVFAALTRDIGRWWAYRGVAGSTMCAEPRPGGRFYEDFGNGAGFLWGTVFHVQPPVLLKLSEPPGTTSAWVSHWAYELEETKDGTLLKFSHHVIADASWDPACARDGWGELLGKHLKDYVERDIVCEAVRSV